MTMMDLDHITLPASEDWVDVRDAVARLCEDFPNEYWLKMDKADSYPQDFVDTLTESGFLGALIPEEYGGSGLPLSAACAVLETIHASGCNAAACHTQMYTMGTVLKYGSDAQKAKYLPGIADGSLRLQAFGVTEPTTGSDTTQLKTRAEKNAAGNYVINGQKVWTSRAFESDLMLLLARTTPSAEVTKRSDGMSVFLLDMRAALGKGLELRKIDAMINHNTCEVFIDNLEIPGDTLVGEEGRGFRYIVDSMNAERILIASECIGDAKYFIRKAAAEANMAKMLAADASWNAAEVCMQVLGGYAFAREYGIERKWREARLYQTAPISKNMILGYLGQHVLGMPRSY